MNSLLGFAYNYALNDLQLQENHGTGICPKCLHFPKHILIFQLYFGLHYEAFTIRHRHTFKSRAFSNFNYKFIANIEIDLLYRNCYGEKTCQDQQQILQNEKAKKCSQNPSLVLSFFVVLKQSRNQSHIRYKYNMTTCSLITMMVLF